MYIYNFFFYLAMVNIPQICIRYPRTTVPTPVIISTPMHVAASTCSRIKNEYLSWSTKYSVKNGFIWRDRDSFMGKMISRRRGHIGRDTTINIPPIAIARHSIKIDIYVVFLIFVIFLCYDILYFFIVLIFSQ